MLTGDYIVTVDDDPIVARLLEKTLRLKSYSFETVEQVLAKAPALNPVAVFVDIHIGADGTGLPLIPILKEFWPFSPILAISGDNSDSLVGEALACGADDFIRKPLNAKEVIARMHIRLTDQAQKESRNVVNFGDIILDKGLRLIKGPRAQRYLSAVELSLLLALTDSKGAIVLKKSLKRICWGNITVTDNALDRKTSEVRKILDQVGSKLAIKSHYGVGLCLDADDVLASPEIVADPTADSILDDTL